MIKRHAQLSLIAALLLLLIGVPMFAEQIHGQARVIQNQMTREESLETQIRTAVQAHVDEAVRNWPSAQAEGIEISTKVMTNPMMLKALLPEHSKIIGIDTASPLSERYSERSVVRVSLQLEDGQLKEMGVPVWISIRKPVWIVTSMIQANQPLNKSQLRLETRDVSHTLMHSVGPESPVETFVARLNMLPGDVLDDRKIIIPPDVRANTDVNIILTSNSDMKINVPGVAMADGRIGEVIRVRQQLFKTRYYMAKIINKNQVQVDN